MQEMANNGALPAKGRYDKFKIPNAFTIGRKSLALGGTIAVLGVGLLLVSTILSERGNIRGKIEDFTRSKIDGIGSGGGGGGDSGIIGQGEDLIREGDPISQSQQKIIDYSQGIYDRSFPQTGKPIPRSATIPDRYRNQYQSQSQLPDNYRRIGTTKLLNGRPSGLTESQIRIEERAERAAYLRRNRVIQDTSTNRRGGSSSPTLYDRPPRTDPVSSRTLYDRPGSYSQLSPKTSSSNRGKTTYSKNSRPTYRSNVPTQASERGSATKASEAARAQQTLTRGQSRYRR